MELTPEAVRRAEFGRSWGGYDMREVDSFLEEIGNGVDGLHARIREVTLRAERAESRGGGGLDDTIKRTLTLAQRAADLVVSEAKGVADRTTAEAAATAARTVAAAQDEALRITARAEADGSRIVAEHLVLAQDEHATLAAQLKAERAVIEDRQRRSRAEVMAMHDHAQATRDQLRAALADHLTRLDVLEFDDPARFAESAAPELAAPDSMAFMDDADSTGTVGVAETDPAESVRAESEPTEPEPADRHSVVDAAKEAASADLTVSG